MALRDDDAPWLAEAPPLKAAPQRRPILNIAIAVLALGAVAAVALLMLLGRKDGGSTQGYMEAAQAPLIEADPGPFKVPPVDPQGLDVEGDGEAIHEVVRGEGVDSRIDMNALPEAPIGRPRDLLPPDGTAAPAAPAGAPAGTLASVPAGQPVQVQVMPAVPAAPVAKPATAALPAAKPASAAPVRTPAPAATAPAQTPAKAPPAATARPQAPATAATIVQIGAFSSEDKAEEEWRRVGIKAGLTAKQVQKLTNASGKTLFRVRGKAADPAEACRIILAAKGACEVVK